MTEKLTFEWDKVISGQNAVSPVNACKTLNRFFCDEHNEAPPFYQLILIHDSIMPVEFLKSLLRDIFNKPTEEAISLTTQVQNNEMAILGVYTRDVAETIMLRIGEYADEYNYPIKCLTRKESHHVI